MASYRILTKASALKELEAVTRKKDRQRIVRRIRELAHEPRPAGCQKLSDRDLYRVRQGNYRIVYEVHDSDLTVGIVKIGHRKDIHRAR